MESYLIHYHFFIFLLPHGHKMAAPRPLSWICSRQEEGQRSLVLHLRLLLLLLCVCVFACKCKGIDNVHCWLIQWLVGRVVSFSSLELFLIHFLHCPCNGFKDKFKSHLVSRVSKGQVVSLSLALLWSWWDPSFLTRNRTWALGSENMAS